MKKIKMIIDCDTGIDDALAIAYILANPDIELLGVTATFGNIDVDSAARNSLSILEMFGSEDVKVYRGASHALNKDSYVRSELEVQVHGRNGIGNVDLGQPKGQISAVPAVDFIIDSARFYQQDLHLVFVGPLTNLAACLQKDEKALAGVGRITIMGGALTQQGNVNRYAEANIHADPTAADFVFSSSVQLDIIPLDVTLKTLFRISDVRHWPELSAAGKHLYEIARYYYVHEHGDENTGGAMHDPLAAMASYDPSIITAWFPCNLSAEEDGRTICTFAQLNLKEKRHRVALDVEAKRFTDTYIETVSELIKQSA